MNYIRSYNQNHSPNESGEFTWVENNWSTTFGYCGGNRSYFIDYYDACYNDNNNDACNSYNAGNSFFAFQMLATVCVTIQFYLSFAGMLHDCLCVCGCLREYVHFVCVTGGVK